MQEPLPPYDVKVAIGLPVDLPDRRVRFDGEVAWFADGAYWFVAGQLGKFGPRSIPAGFFDCYGGCEVSGPGLDELGWFADFLVRVLHQYPERWEVSARTLGRPTVVEREAVQRELVRLASIVRRARESGRPVASFGD